MTSGVVRGMSVAQFVGFGQIDRIQIQFFNGSHPNGAQESRWIDDYRV